MKIEINTDTITAEEARALAIFLVELRHLDREDIAFGFAANTVAVDEAGERPDNSGRTAERGVPATAAGEGNSPGEGSRKAAGRAAKEDAVFVLQNKKTGVSYECNASRKGEVEVAKGHLESWLRDAQTIEEIAGLSAMAETFVAVCFSKKEKTAFAKLVTEVTAALAPGAPAAPEPAEEPKGELPPATASEGATLEQVKTAAKDLAKAKGIAAVEAVLAQFGIKSFKDAKPEQCDELMVALVKGLS